MALRKLSSAGRFGTRYGRRIKQRIIAVEKIQKSKQKCPFCNKLSVKRISSGIWYCKACDSKFAAKAYDPIIKAEAKVEETSEEKSTEEEEK